MPNYCENTMRIVATTDAARSLLPQIVERFSDKNREPSAFQFIHPMPAELEDTTSPGDSPNWYDWRIANWGTKWNECEPYILQHAGDELVVSFQTAWSPPIGIYARLCELGFDVLATYAEQGVGYAGYWHNGHDTELSLSGVNVPDADDEYPEDSEVLEKVFAGTGIPFTLLPAGLGG